jgi:hypothetical protein
MPSVHDFAKKIAEITIGNFLAGASPRPGVELVDHHVTALLQITESKSIQVATIPPHVSKLFAPVDARVEDAEAQQQHPEVLGALAGVRESVVYWY